MMLVIKQLYLHWTRTGFLSKSPNNTAYQVFTHNSASFVYLIYGYLKVSKMQCQLYTNAIPSWYGIWASMDVGISLCLCIRGLCFLRMKEENKTADAAGRVFSSYCHRGSAVLLGYHCMWRGGFFQHPHLLGYSWLPQIRAQMFRLPKHKGPITSASQKRLMS